ncbi:MAG: hypothetical protein HGA80_00445 [Candidatus Omnitrophica bacterium]|nr:hypothetical protein [Candidatus Omnitrophota bacterium]
MAKKETAEEKLLKIIEATKKAQDSSSGAVVPAARRSRGLFAVNTQQLNYLLMVAVLSGVIYCGYEVRNGMELLKQNVSVSVDGPAHGDAINLFVPQIRSLSYYLDKIGTRNIFQPFEKKEGGSSGVVTARAVLEKKMQNFKLVGVAWLDMPESATVMIEDKANGVTKFLKEGDKLEDVTIKTIYTDRVVIGYENEEIVIKL